MLNNQILSTLSQTDAQKEEQEIMVDHRWQSQRCRTNACATCADGTAAFCEDLRCRGACEAGSSATWVKRKMVNVAGVCSPSTNDVGHHDGTENMSHKSLG